MISITCKTAFLFSIFLYIISSCLALEVSRPSCGGSFRGYTTTLFLLCEDQTISSEGEIKFVLGFFTPKGNYNNSKYVGIWYLDDPETVVWVANRDRPLPENSNGSFGIPRDGDGNLQLLDERGNSYFSTKLDPSKNFSSRTTRLLENGNLVLSDESSGNMLWQSFDHPTDTFLPGMKMTENLVLTSWRDLNDPSSGDFRLLEF